MDDERPLFILAGNTPYENRGCEAIIRGTTTILRESFPDPRFVCMSTFQNENQYRIQCQQETDEDITHLATLKGLSKRDVIRSFWRPETWNKVYQYFFDRSSFSSKPYLNMIPYLDDTTAVLSVGGDNYSLDYGLPNRFISLDDLVLAHKRPLAIWGASVGPFGTMPDFERFMSEHLKTVTGIFARESATIDYLKSIGVTENVFPVADPAFLLEPAKPDGEMHGEEEAIGLNMSPWMAKYVTGGDFEQWVSAGASIVSGLIKTTGMPVFLIPHVTSQFDNDYAFLQRVIALLPKNKENITLVDSRYNAAELKWIISQMTLFVGARTHSTIAALSSGVPTLSLSYSINANGINRDIFGHTDYCLDPHEVSARSVADRTALILDQRDSIKMELHKRIPEIQDLARNAGTDLKKIIENSNPA